MSNIPSHFKTTTLRISGMHCASCDILIKAKIQNLSHVKEVIPDYRKKIVTIKHQGTLSLDTVNSVLCEYGYKASNLKDVLLEKSFQDTLIETLVIAVVLGTLYYFLNEFHVFPETLSGSATSFAGALVLGLIASASTCMATTGAIFAAFLHRKERGEHVYIQTLFFILGRLISYSVLGFLFGYFGKGLSYITQLGPALNVSVAVILILTGLDMVRLLSLRRVLSFLPQLPQRFSQENLFKHAKRSAFLLGFITYFLPCGFTISTQAYALSTGNPWFSSQIMFAFALGTIPSLVLITALSRIRNSYIYQYGLKVIGVIIIGVGLNYIISSLALHGFAFTFPKQEGSIVGERAQLNNGKQVVRMSATSSGYYPSQFIVKKNIPVRWEIDGKEIFGCQGTIQSPQAGIRLSYLKEGENVFEFVPHEVGTIRFSCSMGMFSGQFTVID